MISQQWQERQKQGRHRKPLQLTVNVDIVNQDADFAISPPWKPSETYRIDGLSIGDDYLRVEGITITRGELTSSSIDVKEVIGKGSFSTVHRAIWKRMTKNDNTSKLISSENLEFEEVAIKKFSVIDSCRARKQMLFKELRTLSKLECSSLIRLHGAFLHLDDITLVLEYMNGGSLDRLFQQMKHSSRFSKKNDVHNYGDSLLPESLTAAISYQILCGLEYLHSPKRRMLHRDLKPVNVLLDRGEGSVKLCDFGVSSLLGENSLSSTVVGTSMYMSPERLRAKAYGRPSDVWSFGLILVECITGELPWSDVRSIVDLIVTVEETSVDDLIPIEIHYNSLLQEMVSGTLQLDPCKRIPSHLLLHSPWFKNEHKIHSLDEAMKIVKLTLS